MFMLSQPLTSWAELLTHIQLVLAGICGGHETELAGVILCHLPHICIDLMFQSIQLKTMCVQKHIRCVCVSINFLTCFSGNTHLPVHVDLNAQDDSDRN